MLGVGVVYLGMVSAFAGAVSLVKPLSLFGIRTARDMRVATLHTQLDQFTPVHQFNEFHSVLIRAPKEQVYRAIRSVTADEILAASRPTGGSYTREAH